MKIFIVLIVFLMELFCHGQNLVPNGNFEVGNYNGGSNPIEYYSGVYTENWWADLWNSSTHHRFDADMDSTCALDKFFLNL
jgi:hypothetical protein